MSGFLIYHARSRITGSVLASAMDTPHGTEIPAGVNPEWVIRWGSRAPLGAAFRQNLRIVNKNESLSLASDKLGTPKKLQDAGVRVPYFALDPTDLEFPFLGRRIHHARGTDIVLCLQRGDYIKRPRDYYIKYVPTVREFRVHVVGSRVIRIQGKYLDRPELDASWIRNYAHGYRFRSPRKKINSERISTAERAVQALGLDFGAVDLLIGDDGLTYVLEVNTAPACSPLTAACYVGAFQQLLGFPEEQIDLTRLDILSPDEGGGDTEDEVEGEDDTETEVHENA